MAGDNVNIAKEAIEVNNPITSSIVKDVIEGNNPNAKVEPTVVPEPTKEVVEVNKVEPIEAQPTLKDIEDLEAQLLSSASSKDGKATPVEFEQSIEAIRKQYADLADKQKREYEEELAKMKSALEDQKQKEVMAGMSETEKIQYSLGLKIKELQETLNVFEKRNKDLEDKLEKQNNEKYISDKIAEAPFIKDFVSKLNVKTKSEYETKILPIIEQMKELQELKTQNNIYGNKNAFANYGMSSVQRDSDIYKEVETYSKDFLKDIIRK